MKIHVSLVAVWMAIGVCFSQEKAIKNISGNYKNPVVAANRPDPTVVKGNDGHFYMYATEAVRNVPIMKSKDLMQWTFCNTAFTDETRPTFVTKGGVWAPDINYINEQYVLYYAMSTWGGEWACGIGVATAKQPEGPFVDHGPLFRSKDINVQNSIDASYFEYEGKKYVIWGSFRGIYAIELAADGLSLMSGAKKKQLAGTAFEAAYIYPRGKYYYMFASIGSCCEGAKSTYQVVVGRSKNIWGPYVDKTGKRMLKNGYSLVIGSNDHFVGNGHGSQIVKDDAGQDWMLYHGFDKSVPENGRLLLLDQIKWDDKGWPYIEGGSPSYQSQKGPVFK